MRKYLLFFVLIGYQAIAQIEFVPGFYIDNNGVRTNCLIRDEGWRNNPTSFQYKQSPDQQSTTATIERVSKFGVDQGDLYERFTVKIDQSSKNINALSKEKQPEFKEMTVFLKYVTEADISLLSYEAGDHVRFFVYNKNSAPEQLIFKDYLLDPSTIAQNNYFRQQLYTSLKSARLTQKDFEHLQYKQQDLVRVFEKYYADNGSAHTVTKETSKTAIHLAVTGGVNFSGVRLVNDAQNVDISTGMHASPGFGFEVESILPYNHGKWAIFANPNYHYLKYEETSVNPFIVDYKAVNIPIGVRHYMFLKNPSRLFLTGGYALGFSFSSALQYRGFKFDVSKGGNLFFGAGYNYGKYAIEVRYNTMQSMIVYSFWDAGYGAVQLVASYKLF
ncbi:hypothetical protein HYN48_08675 [Flavobacterium magnum]|uniref:Outer membrane protein beta-barrel domain-containing protein n=2 Tax=Flavobacterium magnum TaxID=2162713 RepID=A0A2S0RFZ2_9FLAO|nr:hypothetical protein HYN48_08675 [Flavobacterium magnum]